jgi:hypothetical protein
VSSIADTAGNTYSYTGRYTDSDATIEIWFAQNITGNASNVVTATLSGAATERRISVTQYSGCATSSIQDTGYAPAGNVTAASPAQSTAATTANSGEVIIGAAYKNDDNTNPPTSPISGTTLRQQVPNGTDPGHITLENITTTAGSYRVGFNIGDDIPWMFLARAFKVAAAAQSKTWVVWIPMV